MSQSVILDLPDSFFKPLERTARVTQRPIEELLLGALQSSLPPLDGLPANVIEDLTSLESLADDDLRSLMLETVPVATQQAISALIDKEDRNADENRDLEELQNQADLIMLRKARAAVLLRFRGHRIPTLSELEKLEEPE